MKYVPTHLVVAGTLDSISVMDYNMWSRSDAFTVGIAQRIKKTTVYETDHGSGLGLHGCDSRR